MCVCVMSCHITSRRITSCQPFCCPLLVCCCVPPSPGLGVESAVELNTRGGPFGPKLSRSKQPCFTSKDDPATWRYQPVHTLLFTPLSWPHTKFMQKKCSRNCPPGSTSISECQASSPWGSDEPLVWLASCRISLTSDIGYGTHNHANHPVNTSICFVHSQADCVKMFTMFVSNAPVFGQSNLTQRIFALRKPLCQLPTGGSRRTSAPPPQRAAVDGHGCHGSGSHFGQSLRALGFQLRKRKCRKTGSHRTWWPWLSNDITWLDLFFLCNAGICCLLQTCFHICAEENSALKPRPPFFEEIEICCTSTANRILHGKVGDFATGGVKS